MLQLSPRTYLPAILSLVLLGCGQAKPDPKPSPVPNSGTPTTTETKPGEKPETKPGNTTTPVPETKPAATTAATTPATGAAAPFSEAAYLTDDVVGLVVAHPRRVTEWEVYKLIKGEEGVLPEDVKFQLSQAPVQPEAIERVVVVFDQTFVNNAATAAGLETKSQDEVSQPIPTVIVTLAEEAPTEELLQIFDSKEDVGGETLHTNPFGAAAWVSADKKTVIFGTKESITKSLAAKKAGKLSTAKVLTKLNPTSDLTLAFALDGQAGLIEQAVQLAPIPGVGLVQQLHGLSVHFSITGKPGGKLLEVVATAADEDSAKQMADMLTPLLDSGKGSAKENFAGAAEAGDDNDKAGIALAGKLVESANITQTGKEVVVVAMIPEGFDNLPTLIKPAMEKARSAQQKAQKRNNLKQIAIAFHNYHDVFTKFPGAGKSADGKEGLSWRVHLLPYLDQPALYQQFNLDEPWDSETNKALIEQMPDIFKSEGVVEPGKTAIHLITGPGAPFAKNATPKIANFTDGTSNTILAVEAGADKADVWTKPGGLDFDEKDPIKALGKLADTFNAMLCDGSVRSISAKIDAANLRRLFQLADGEPLEDF